MLIYVGYAINELANYSTASSDSTTESSTAQNSILSGVGKSSHVQFFNLDQHDFFDYEAAVPADGAENSWMTSMAYAIVKSSDGSILSQDVTYGKFIPYYKKRANGVLQKQEKLTEHACTSDDLGLSGSDTT